MRHIRLAWIALLLAAALGCGDDDGTSMMGDDAGPGVDAFVEPDAGGPVPTTATVETGMIEGVEENGVRTFFGVPYGKAERWRAPVPADPWDGVRSASEPGPVCPQLDLLTMTFKGEEDCLLVNIWAPADAEGAPVMVYVHGGAFRGGNPAYSGYYGDTFAREHGVILVTMGYRVSTLGFLAHPALTEEDPAFPTSGNYGMMDIIRSLQWVQDNIAAFGGDPDKVLFFGLSSGSDAAASIAVSPMAEGLYTRLGLLSGALTILPQFATLAEAEATGVSIAAGLGCDDPDPATVRACLRALTPEDAVGAALRELTGYVQKPGGLFYQGRPSPDPDFFQFNVDGFVIPEQFRDAARAGTLPDVPVIIGHVLDEGTLFQSPILEGTITTEEEYMTALMNGFGDNAAAVAAMYPVSAYDGPNEALTAVTTEGVFQCAGRIAATTWAEAGTPVYKYVLVKQSLSPTLASFGVFHGSDTPYIFGNTDPFWGRVPDDGQELADAMRSYLARFADTGDPNGDGGLVWPQWDPATDPYMAFDAPPRVEMAFKTAACDFWASLP